MVFDRHAEPAYPLRHESVLAAQPRHPMPTARQAGSPQRLPRFHRAIAGLRGRMEPVHVREQVFVRLVTATGGPGLPGVVATAAHLEHLTQPLD